MCDFIFAHRSPLSLALAWRPRWHCLVSAAARRDGFHGGMRAVGFWA
ncbi:hypothetical protein HHJ81_04910 [Mobiluncus mulieris]|nr:hypothetical protein [Mobiluncus mulieris]NMW60440.1 hypothetical protein [Mobiluncus mulieris]